MVTERKGKKDDCSIYLMKVLNPIYKFISKEVQSFQINQQKIIKVRKYDSSEKIYIKLLIKQT